MPRVAVCTNPACRAAFQTNALSLAGRQCPKCRKARNEKEKVAKKRKRLTDAENEQLRRLERLTCRVHPH